MKGIKSYWRSNHARPALPAAEKGETRPLVELCNVTKVYMTEAGGFPALKNINLSFQPGEYACIMGKSGSGKSTLINMITGIDQPTSGSVRVGAAEIHRLRQGQLAVWRGRNLGIVFQFFQLLPTLSVLENTLLAMDYSGVVPVERRQRQALELLRLVGLEDAAEKLPAALSGGQQQIAAIARALANDPPIIVADEPTGNLDSRSAAHILEIFDNLTRQGKTILIVTHDSSLAQRSQRRVLITDGELVDENIAAALPELFHPLLLRLTKEMSRQDFSAGDFLAGAKAPENGLCIITRGQVEILRHRHNKEDEELGRMSPGGTFSTLDQLENESPDLSIRAAPGEPMQALVLSQETFERFLEDAPTMQQALRQAAHQRRLTGWQAYKSRTG